MDNFNEVVNYIFEEHKGNTINVMEISKATGIPLNEVAFIVECLIEEKLLLDMEECEADDPDAKIGKVCWIESG